MSLVFTWHLPFAREFAENTKKKIIVGGPATEIMPDYFNDLDNVKRGDRPPISFLEAHNPLATFTTRGCPNSCSYCAVPKLEKDFVEIDTYPVKPLVCDNNFLAASSGHIETFVDRAQDLPFVDFNQGLDARLFTPEHAKLFKRLPCPTIRFSMDTKDREGDVFRAIDLCKKNKLNNISIYILINYEETPEDALYKLEYIKSLGVQTFPMRYQPLWSLEYNEHISEKWRYVFGKDANKWLKEICRYYSMYKMLGIRSFDIWMDARLKEEPRTLELL
jgi:hypothetical protein